MELRSKSGNLFTLTVERYEFPDEELGPTDDNPADEDFDTGRFLVVSHRFGNADGHWRGEFTTMDTNELSRFIDWLASVQSNEIKTHGAYFTERCLEFTLDESFTSLLVHLSSELLPPWGSDGDTIVLNFPMAGIDLDATVASLRRQAARFPGRPPLSNAG
ncbi:WapI family immunity protein [Posidoniimonas polymericola]|uniref:WapI family immunity protein n=1 Tax=Posidoniimonas polymericola TaxID=2528002 RepID=UPI0011B6EC67|nr:hypothetical protein [Posidoniimonas polymericola]